MSPLFFIAGLISIAGALGVLLARQPVHQVLATVVNFIGLAILFLSLHAEFMAVVQIIIYGGAVMVLFLFVISLLSARKELTERRESLLKGQKVAGAATGGAVLLMLALVGLFGYQAGDFPPVAESFGNVKAVGYEVLTTHLFPFEVIAFILMVAVIGVVILVGRQRA